MAERDSGTGKAATQERILAAATELFITRSYERTTIAEIATLADVSRATVFWHFGNKRGLFQEAFARLLAPFQESLERDYGAIDTPKRLEEQLASSEEFARTHSAEIAAFVRLAVESPDFRETMISKLLGLNQLFAESLTRTVSEFAPPGRDPKLLGLGLMLAFNANLLLSLFDGSPRAMEERAAAIRELARLVASPVPGRSTTEPRPPRHE
jgi:AcrR family transcriptional regulator